MIYVTLDLIHLQNAFLHCLYINFKRFDRKL